MGMKIAVHEQRTIQEKQMNADLVRVVDVKCDQQKRKKQKIFIKWKRQLT